MPNRKEIRAALIQRLKAEVTGVLSVYARDLTSEELVGCQPCIVVRALGSAPAHDANEPEVWRHGYGVIIYARNAAKDGSTDDVLDDLVDEVRAALAWRPGEGMQAMCTTLGGLCEYARVANEITYEQGETSDQAAAIMPLEVLVADQ